MAELFMVDRLIALISTHRSKTIPPNRIHGPPGRVDGGMVVAQYWQTFKTGVRASWAMYAVELTPAVFFGSKIPRTVTQALFFVLIAKAAGGDDMARFALIGNAVHAATFSAVIFMAIVVELEKWAGTLQHLIAAPTHWLPLMIGRSAATFGDALLGTFAVFAILFPILNPDIAIINLLRAVPLMLLAIVSASGLGWLLGAISLPIRWGTLISNTVGYVMMVLCGINFPVTILPPVIQAISRAIPMTNSLLAVRAVIDGASYNSVAALIGMEIVVALVYGLLAWLMFAYRLQSVRQGATLDLF
jgi:ABC-2 type transport system permease protein